MVFNGSPHDEELEVVLNFQWGPYHHVEDVLNIARMEV
jgi:hypothetical protein